MGFITKGKGSGRKVIPIKDKATVRKPRAMPTMTIDNLAVLLVEIMDTDEKSEYVRDGIDSMLSDDKEYYSKMSKMYDSVPTELTTFELAEAIVDDMEDKKFLDLALKFKIEELNADKSYYKLALERFSKRKR